MRANSARNVHALPVPDQTRPYHVKQSSKELTGAYFNTHRFMHRIPVLFVLTFLSLNIRLIFGNTNLFSLYFYGEC